jgi:hypothetical protein
MASHCLSSEQNGRHSMPVIGKLVPSTQPDDRASGITMRKGGGMLEGHSPYSKNL